MKKIYFLSFFAMAAAVVNAQTYHNLSLGDLTQNWTNTGLITANDNWSGLASIRGYRGDGLTGGTGTDPQTITADDSPGVLNVIANQTNPNTLATGGVAEFDGIANPTIALQGSGTADAPYIQLYLDCSLRDGVVLAFNAIDLDGSTDNAVQQLVVQYRIGTTGVFTNVPSGYFSDVTAGPSLSGTSTPVFVTLPLDVGNQPQVQVRIMTTNAAGNDEWIGIDDISVTGVVLLPVTFSRFGGTVTANGNQLSWAAAASGNGMFSVEKSIDGRTFNEIAGMAAISGDRQYTYTDISNSPSIVYYRVAYTENGIKKYSSIIRLASQKQSLAFTRFISVNGHMAEAEIYSDRAATATLRITAINGTVLQQQTLGLQKGSQVLDIQLPLTTNGMYIITLQRGDEMITRKWIR